MNDLIVVKMGEAFKDFRIPKYNDIPNVGLYLNQAEKYVSDIIAPFGNISLTSSMIGNYVKQKLITRPIKKQYNREHIAALICIAFCKSVMTIDKVKLVLDLLTDNYSNKETAYNTFIEEIRHAIHFSCGLNTTFLSTLTDADGSSNDKVLLRSIVIAIADSIFLDKYFSLMNN